MYIQDCVNDFIQIQSQNWIGIQLIYELLTK